MAGMVLRWTVRAGERATVRVAQQPGLEVGQWLPDHDASWAADAAWTGGWSTMFLVLGGG